MEEEKVLFLITNRPGERFVAGVIKERLILFLLEKRFLCGLKFVFNYLVVLFSLL